MNRLFARSIAALATILSISACQQADHDHDRDRATVVQSATVTGPEFDALAAHVRELRVSQSLRIHAMTPAQRATYLQRLVQLRPTLEDGDSNTLTQFSELTGITIAELKQLQEQTVLFKKSYPDEPGGPSGPAPTDVPDIDTDDLPDIEPNDSSDSFDDNGGSGGGDGGGGEADQDCIDECNDAYDDAALVAEAVYIQQNIACILAAPATGGIGTLLCGAAALTELAITMAVADKNRDDCIDVCYGLNPDGECSDDWDCDDSEFCWKGPAGLGDNECRDKKELGQVCSRDGKCESGCCKYDFWVNPIQFTCQPAQDCN